MNFESGVSCRSSARLWRSSLARPRVLARWRRRKNNNKKNDPKKKFFFLTQNYNLNFDFWLQVATRPWSPNQGKARELTKLCNHKRKLHLPATNNSTHPVISTSSCTNNSSMAISSIAANIELLVGSNDKSKLGNFWIFKFFHIPYITFLFLMYNNCWELFLYIMMMGNECNVCGGDDDEILNEREGEKEKHCRNNSALCGLLLKNWDRGQYIPYACQ